MAKIRRIASHALGIGERYHTPLRNTYRKLKVEFPQMNKHILLSISVKAGNDTLGPEGIVPSALVFGEFLTVSTILGTRVPRQTLTERAQVVQRARKIMAQELADSQMKRSIKHKKPSATDHVYDPGEYALVLRDTIVNNRIGEFIGPFIVLAFESC